MKSLSNGDCLYNSASILICGNGHLPDLLRGMVSIELFLERKYYLRHPYIVTKQTLLPDRNIFAMCLTNSSTANIKNTIENYILCIINESISNCNRDCWSSQISSLSSVQCKICFFPRLSSVLPRLLQIMSISPTTSTNNVSLSHDFYKCHGIVQWHCRTKG